MIGRVQYRAPMLRSNERKNSNFYKYNLLPGEEYINQVERMFAFEIAYKHPTVRSALDKITSDLTRNGVMFMQGKQPLTVSFEFEQQIKKQLIPCERDAVFSIAAQGVLPLYKRIDKESGHKVTVCPHYDTYKISVLYDKGIPQFRFWWIARIPLKKHIMDYVDKNVKIISGFGYDPDINGTLNSIISSLFPTVNFIDSMLEFATRAEEQNTDPTMIIQSPQPKESNIESANISMPFNVFVDSNPNRVRECDKYYQQDLQARFNVRQVSNDAYTNEQLKSMFGMQSRVTASIFNRLTLQEGQTLANRQLPRARSDLIDLINISKETVSQLFKIPQELFSGGFSRHIARDTATLLDKQYSETLETWARRLEPIVTNIYKEMYEEEDRKYFEKNVDKQLRKEVPELTQTLSNIRVIVNFSQRLPTEEMEYAVNRGILPYRFMAENWLIQNGIPKELLANTEDILSDAEKKQMLLSKCKSKTAASGQQQSEESPKVSRKRRSNDVEEDEDEKEKKKKKKSNKS